MDKKDIIKEFDIEGEVISIIPYGSGHINDTYLVEMSICSNIKKYILQRINSSIFKDVEKLMENIYNVSNFLAQKNKSLNKDVERENLNIVPLKNGKTYYKDMDNNYWRIYKFIENAKTYDKVLSAKDFYESGFAFGNFQAILADFDATILNETIADFHNTKKRFEDFKKVLEIADKKRYELAKESINFVLENEYLANVFYELIQKKELPLRVTHNDTKLNNIMIDDISRKAICVIDLDTVMPGLSINDFGDSIRFGANKAKEDEIDLDKVALDLDLFRAYAKGFLEACKDKLSKNEIDNLSMACLVMTYECGMRFLSDFLVGDKYFKISRENHNLDRARCQFALVRDMQKQYEKMKEIIREYTN